MVYNLIPPLIGPDLMFQDLTRVPRRKLRREERRDMDFLRRILCSLGLVDTCLVS